MPLVRSIGRWTMTALVINTVIGSGIFGVPSELIRLLGRASPLGIIIAALLTALFAAPMTEVASQFSESGGVYLYVRTAFGRFAGLQVGWFWLLTVIAAGAASANLFVNYLADIFPHAGHGGARALVIACLIGALTMANCVGARRGAQFSNVLTVAKLLPLALLIFVGLARFGLHPSFAAPAQSTSPGLQSWLSALPLLVFLYGGFEVSLTPAGEIEGIRRAVPFALGVGLMVSALVFTLVQTVVIATIGMMPTDHPLAEAASKLLGHYGGSFVAIAVMLSTYGVVSTIILAAPRFLYALSEHGEAPISLAKLHPRFQTPTNAILLCALLMWILATTGTFLWVLSLTAGSMMIYDAAVCAALIRLRRSQPEAKALRVPLGPVLAILGVALSVAVLTRLELHQLLLMGITALIAAANWWWARRRGSQNLAEANVLPETVTPLKGTEIT
jgi:basic amino acid/polyamine antiporter, APA family